MILTLKGKTNKGKNRIREHGEVWEVLEWEYALRTNMPFRMV